MQRDMWDMLLATTNRGAPRQSVRDSALLARIDGCNKLRARDRGHTDDCSRTTQVESREFCEREGNYQSLLLFL